MAQQIIGIVGSYRKGGIIDQVVTEVLSAAASKGSQTSKIYLLDQHIEFCTNCRACTQTPGPQRGRCIHEDDMEELLQQIDQADGLVVGASVNCFNLNALTRRFMERLTVYVYWPWDQNGPEMRVKEKARKAVLVTSTAMPSLMARFFTGAKRALKLTANTIGATPIQTLFVGSAAQSKQPALPENVIMRARKAGFKLAMS